MSRSERLIVCVLSAASLAALSACGQTGPLYLPDDDAIATDESAVPATAEAEPEDEESERR